MTKKIVENKLQQQIFARRKKDYRKIQIVTKLKKFKGDKY